jgi:hypothetical protein
MRTLGTSILLMAALTACQQTTETNTTAGSTSTVKTSTTTGTVTMPSVDTAATANAKSEVKDAGEKMKEGAREAAHATGTALEKAGQKIQEKTGTEKKH